MEIITIKFPHGEKTYDYLLDNPYKLDFIRNNIIKRATGISGRYGISYDTIRVCKITQVKEIPAHVTACLIVDKNRFITSNKIVKTQRVIQTTIQEILDNNSQNNLNTEQKSEKAEESAIETFYKLLGMNPIEKLEYLYKTGKYKIDRGGK